MQKKLLRKKQQKYLHSVAENIWTLFSKRLLSLTQGPFLTIYYNFVTLVEGYKFLYF